MNSANLQLEGLYLALAAINNALVAKGIMTREELDAVLRGAERTALTDPRIGLSPASREAVAFPARFLALANHSASETETVSFSELAKLIGETKPPLDLA